MNVLVTGATGFIGRALVSRMVSEKRGVVRGAVRNHSATLPAGAERVVVGDVANHPDYRRALDGIDAVVHLAARAHVLSETEARAIDAFRLVNVNGAITLAQAAAARGIRRFVFLSSIGVNGTRTFGRPFTESDAPRPREAYAISKFEAEQALRRVAAETGMEVVIIRPPLVHGYDAPGNFGRLVRLVRRGIPLPFGAVHNSRSLVGLDNLVDFIIACADAHAARNKTFLVSDDEDLSTTELIRRLARAMDRRTPLIPVPAAAIMAAAAAIGKRAMAERLFGSLQVDSSKARRMLQWVPPISIDEGLRRAVGT